MNVQTIDGVNGYSTEVRAAQLVKTGQYNGSKTQLKAQYNADAAVI